MEMTLASDPPFFTFATWAFVAVVWIGPIGLFVLRKKLSNGNNGAAVLKNILFALTALTAPAAAIMVLIIAVGAAEAFHTLWSLLKAIW